eukprot:CAMPEP_0116574606 /NCGR_PEP_ID=MMETSP0397-20121206/19490_1 /TAXON_ID=216820 /ORGANISM="Cyclophora tenuis, Strain ECT3854" /LENGTH=201 /DNA_ID=CAMNT_0004103395 /DNA_START=459 /DNA_END=1064 /DNA_ORIENTATION=+
MYSELLATVSHKVMLVMTAAPPVKTKRVRFREVCPTDVIPSKLGYLEQTEVEQCWRTSSDKREIEKECVATAHALLQWRFDPRSFDSKMYSTRGLEEGLSTHYATALQKQRKDVRTAVLEEQKVQRKLQSFDPDQIRKVSERHTCWSVELARELAAEDSKMKKGLELEHWNIIQKRANEKNPGAAKSKMAWSEPAAGKISS